MRAMKLATPHLRHLLAASVVCAMAIPGAAQARVFVGVGVGVPFFGPPAYYPPPFHYPPPMYYHPPPMYYHPPPPVFYAPPPVVYTPPPVTYAPPRASAAGQSCQAGAYVCPMDRPAPPGAACYCLGNGSQKVWGRTN